MLFFSLLHRAWQVMSCSDVTCAITCHRCRRRNKEKPISLLEFRQKIDVDFVAIQPFNWKRKLLATYTLRCGIVVYIFLSFVFFCTRFVFTIEAAIKRWWSRFYYCCAHRQPLLLVFWLLFYCMRHLLQLFLRWAELSSTATIIVIIVVVVVVVVDSNTVHCNLYPFAGGQFHLLACGNNNNKLLWSCLLSLLNCFLASTCRARNQLAMVQLGFFGNCSLAFECIAFALRPHVRLHVHLHHCSSLRFL